MNKICGQEEQSHNPWISKENPGCYKTVAICAGHCGGHVEPQVNLAIASTYETLMANDCYAMKKGVDESEWLSEESFDLSKDEKHDSKKSIDDWKKTWTMHIGDWTDPLPNSFKNTLQTVGENFLSFGADTIDGFTGWCSDGIAKIMGTYEEESEETEDKYEFEGWYEDDKVTLKRHYIKDMEAFYGTFECSYAEGYKNFADMDTAIPMGITKSFTQDEIKKEIDSIKKANYNIGKEQEDIIKEALTMAGNYWPEESMQANLYAIQNKYGKTDSSGYIAGMLNRLYPDRYQYTNVTEDTWYGYKDDKVPGSICTRINYQTGEKIPMIYLGSSGYYNQSIYVYFDKNEGVIYKKIHNNEFTPASIFDPTKH